MRLCTILIIKCRLLLLVIASSTQFSPRGSVKYLSLYHLSIHPSIHLYVCWKVFLNCLESRLDKTPFKLEYRFYTGLTTAPSWINLSSYGTTKNIQVNERWKNRWMNRWISKPHLGGEKADECKGTQSKCLRWSDQFFFYIEKRIYLLLLDVLAQASGRRWRKTSPRRPPIAKLSSFLRFWQPATERLWVTVRINLWLWLLPQTWH